MSTQKIRASVSDLTQRKCRVCAMLQRILASHSHLRRPIPNFENLAYLVNFYSNARACSYTTTPILISIGKPTVQSNLMLLKYLQMDFGNPIARPTASDRRKLFQLPIVEKYFNKYGSGWAVFVFQLDSCDK